MISLIAAVAQDGSIGNANQLLWHISGDLKYFKQTTAGHTIIMGRKTFESIGRPLPGRRNVVVSRQKLNLIPPPEKKKDGTPSNTTLMQIKNLESYLEHISKSENSADEEFFVIGGGSIYKTAFKYADRLYITHIIAKPESADTFFPEINEDVWVPVKVSGIFTDEENGIQYRFATYERKDLLK